MNRTDVGSLEFVEDPFGARSGHVGAATREIPYWTLTDEAGESWGRLCLLFATEQTAINHMWTWLTDQHRAMLSYGVSRRLRNVQILPTAKVTQVGYDTPLTLWLQGVMLGVKDPRVPAGLLAHDFDVARIVRSLYPTDFEQLVVTERALREGRVICSPGREFVFKQEAR